MIYISPLSKSWWKYAFEKPWTWRKVWCRITGHRGMVWFNSHGLEPDTRCKNCGDQIG